MWKEGGLYKQVCDSVEFAGNLWAEREREGEEERGGEEKREGGGRGGRREWKGEGEEEGKDTVGIRGQFMFDFLRLGKL